jgi:SAM-dependent methyltransferase
MRRWLHGQLDLPEGGTVLDCGCGTGDDVGLLAQAHPEVRFVGVDRSEEWIRQAQARPLPNVEFRCADVGASLPFADGSVDAVYSVNVLECLPNKTAFLRECARVLRPGGRILIAHYDWDTQTFDGDDRALVRKIVHAFNDWKQAWMEDIDPWAGRRLIRYVADEGSFTGEIRAHTLLSRSFAPESYGRRQAESFAALARRGMIAAEEYETFFRSQEEAAARDAFLYSVTMFAFAGAKPP